MDPSTLTQLETLLLIPRSAALRLLLRCPALEAVPVGEVMARILELKEILPGSNVARIIELLPNAFFSDFGWEVTAGQVREAAGVLREGLEGADIDKMAEEDPTVLFEPPESLRTGVRRLRELWDIDAAALAASDVAELALAVRALSLTKLPPSY